MKTYRILPVLLALPFHLQAATLLLPSTPVSASSPNPATDPNLNVSIPFVASIFVDTTHEGTSASGAYSASATGGTSISLAGGLIGARLATHTTVGPTDIKFGTTTTYTGAVGSILANSSILSAVVGAGLAPEWSATIDLNDLGLNLQPSTTYDLSFNLAQTTSLLGDISPAVLNSFTVSVDHSAGVLPAQVLGLLDATSSSGLARFRFTTGSTIVDPTLQIGASALVDTDLLGGLLGQPNPTLYTLSGFNLTAIPEPNVVTLFGLFGVALLFRRRQ